MVRSTGFVCRASTALLALPPCWAVRKTGGGGSQPKGEIRGVRRRYRPGTLILETEFETAEGVVEVIDFMPVRDRTPDLVRIVRRRPRQGADAMRAHDSIRLWFDRSMGSRHAHRFKGDRRPRHALPRHVRQVARRKSAHRGRFHRFSRRETMLCAAVACVSREARRLARREWLVRRYRTMVETMGRSLSVRGTAC